MCSTIKELRKQDRSETRLVRLLAVTILSFALLGASGESTWLSFDGDGTVRSPDVTVLSSSQFETIVELDIHGVEIDDIAVAGERYQVITLPENGTTLETGKPQLPMVMMSIGIPDGANVRMDLIELDYMTLTGYRICPVQKPAVGSVETKDFVIDSELYARDTYYPESIAVVSDPAIWRDLNLVNLRLYPVAYNPAKGELKVYQRIVLKLSHNNGRHISKTVLPRYDRMYRSAILNYDYLGFTRGYRDGPGVRYLVITHDSLVSGVQPLAEWHHKRGMEVEIALTSQVGSTPEEIKSCISDRYYTYGTEYVLLVGDVENIPIYPSWDGHASDYWYACITGGDNIDLYADLSLGRLSVKSLSELDHQVEKTLTYLKDPPLDDWLTKSILCAHCETLPDNYGDFKDTVRTHGYTFFTPTFDTAYGRSNGTTAQVLNAINEGRNIVNYRGHGRLTFWRAWGCNGDSLHDHQVLGLTNGDRTPIVLNMCCWNGSIENSTSDCLCESWMKADDGAVAAWGATKITYTNPNNRFDEHVYKAFCDTLPNIFCIGDVTYYANAQIIPLGSEAEVNVKQNLLLGDPCVEVGTGIPVDMVVDHPDSFYVGPGEFVVDVTSSSVPIENALVCVLKDADVYEYGYTDVDGQLILSIWPMTTGMMSVTVTAHGYLLYEGETVVWGDPAVLECSLWALPDTVIVGQAINVWMRVENTGGSCADSVVPQINHLGDGSVILYSGPTPLNVDLGSQDDTIFSWTYTAEDTHWVCWAGYASGRDHSSGSAVTSPEDTSNQILIQTSPDVVFLSNSVEPDTLTQGQISGYTLLVKNTGEAWVYLTPQTMFTYSDASGDTVLTQLDDSTFVEGLTDSVVLSFGTVMVPRDMEPGDWLSTVDLDGVGRNGYSYSSGLVADAVTIQSKPEVEDMAETVSPEEVSQGQIVPFTVQVLNSGGVGVTLDLTSQFRFTDEVHTYQSLLSAPETLEVGVTDTLDFGIAQVPHAIRDSTYSVTLYLHGNDFNGAEYSDTIVTVGRNWVTVETPAQLDVLEVMAGTDTVGWGQDDIPVDVVVENLGGADAQIDSISLRFSRGMMNLDSEYGTVLSNPIGSLPGFATDTLSFRVDVGLPATGGWVTIHSRIFGRDVNSDALTSDTTAAQPDSWYVQAPAELVCSVWALLETVIIGEDIGVYMSVANPGSSYVDSVVPHVNPLGSGSAALEIGPIPSYADIGPQEDTIFSWVYIAADTGWLCWAGYASGRDHNTQSEVSSPADTSDHVLILSAFIRADGNADGTVGMSDAVFILIHLYIPGSLPPSCMDAADVDDNGEIDMSDAMFILKCLYVPGAPDPPVPFPNCGVDPTADDLGCNEHPCMNSGVKSSTAE